MGLSPDPAELLSTPDEEMNYRERPKSRSTKNPIERRDERQRVRTEALPPAGCPRGTAQRDGPQEETAEVVPGVCMRQAPGTPRGLGESFVEARNLE